MQRPPAPDRPSTQTPGPLYETEFSPYVHSTARHPAAPGYTERHLDGRILETVHPAVMPASIGGAALVLAILQMPYEFYVLLRWVVPAMAIWICTIASGQKRTGWVVVFTLVAVLWNPLIPFEMPRSAWVLPDIIGAILFARAAANLPASKPSLRQY